MNEPIPPEGKVFYINAPGGWTVREKTPAEKERSRKYLEQLEAWRKEHPGEPDPSTVTYIINAGNLSEVPGSDS